MKRVLLTLTFLLAAGSTSAWAQTPSPFPGPQPRPFPFPWPQPEPLFPPFPGKPFPPFPPEFTPPPEGPFPGEAGHPTCDEFEENCYILVLDGPSLMISEDLRLRFTDLKDSRCPLEVNCVWAGEAFLRFELKSSDTFVREFVLADSPRLGAGEAKSFYDELSGVHIELVDLTPRSESSRFDRPRAKVIISRIMDI